MAGARAGPVYKMGSVKGQVRANRAKIQGGFTSLKEELGRWVHNSRGLLRGVSLARPKVMSQRNRR